MKIKIGLILLFFMLCNCKTVPVNINDNDILNININKIQSPEQNFKITDYEDIQKIVNLLNMNIEEPAKFAPVYILEIIYKNERIKLWVNNSYIKINLGKTYKLKVNLEKELDIITHKYIQSMEQNQQ